MKFFRFNDLSKLDNNKNIFFRKYEFVLSLFEQAKYRDDPFILISGNSDYPVTDELLSMAPPSLKKWFCQVVQVDSPLVVPVPFGLENTEECAVEMQGSVPGPWRTLKKETLETPPQRDPTKEVYANFNFGNYFGRNRVAQICQNLPHITCHIYNKPQDHAPLSFYDYALNILDHKMVVCPRGNAPADTHRLWEVIRFGRVPIVKSKFPLESFLEAPIIALSDWNQLSDLDFLNSEYERVKNNPKDLAYSIYWENLINGWANKIL